MRMIKHFISMILCVSMAIPSCVFADNMSSQATITSEAATISVTVPTVLPVTIAADGTVTTATDVKVINNSAAPVRAIFAGITMQNGWSLNKFSTDYKKIQVDSKEISIKICDREVFDTMDSLWDAGIRTEDRQLLSTISGGSSYPISYTAKAATQSTAKAATVANVVFTAEWDPYIFVPIEKKASLDDYTWAEISEIATYDNVRDYVSIGDTKTIHVEGTIGTLDVNQNLKAVVIGVNHNEELEGKGITFQIMMDEEGNFFSLKDSYYNTTDENTNIKKFNINHNGYVHDGDLYEGRNSGWARSDIRYDILGSADTAHDVTHNCDASVTTAINPVVDTYMAALSEDLRMQLKPMMIYSNNTGSFSDKASEITATIDYLPLPSECEIYGEVWDANPHEQDYQAQYEYYRLNHFVSSDYIWTRSKNIRDMASGYFNEFVMYGNSSGGIRLNQSLGLAPIFRI